MPKPNGQHCMALQQFRGTGRFLTGFGSDFRKRPDPVPNPDPDLNKFSANFFPGNLF
jgi:hypothetical protein